MFLDHKPNKMKVPAVHLAAALLQTVPFNRQKEALKSPHPRCCKQEVTQISWLWALRPSAKRCWARTRPSALITEQIDGSISRMAKRIKDKGIRRYTRAFVLLLCLGKSLVFYAFIWRQEYQSWRKEGAWGKFIAQLKTINYIYIKYQYSGLCVLSQKQIPLQGIITVL